MRRVIRTTLLLALVAAVLVPGAAATAQDNPTVDVFTVGYTPEALTIEVGQTVTFTNTDGTHTVTSDDCEGDGCYTNAAGTELDSGTFRTDETFEFTFDEVGDFAYFCRIHSSPNGSSQNGVISVTEAQPEPEPEPEPNADVETSDATDPIANALAWSGLLPDGGTADALLGTTNGFADSLSSGAAQGSDTPLLLNPPDALAPAVLAELQRLGVQNITVLGGPVAISEDVVAALQAQGFTVARASGPTRIETALAAAELIPDHDAVIIARAFGEGTAGFADSLGAGALGAQLGWPILLTPTETLDEGVATYLTDNMIATAVIAGGPAAISEEVATAIEALGIDVQRDAGLTRFGTASSMRQRLTFNLFDGTGGVAPPTIIDGTGELAWSSGFAAALHSEQGTLLSAGDILPAPTVVAIQGLGDVRCGPLVADAACTLADGAATADVIDNLHAVMDDAQEVPPNESGASGEANVYTTAVDGVVCYDAYISNATGPVIASHVHTGAFGETGPPVITMELGDTETEGDIRVGCTGGLDQAVIDAMVADPGAHYVNLHTEANMPGEVRGQLFAEDDTVTTTMDGGADSPNGEADPEASGIAVVYDTGVADEVCYAVFVQDLEPEAIAAHIHLLETGDTVVPMDVGGGQPNFAGCVRDLDEALVTDIFADPGLYYVNVHNKPFPGGAISGVLA